MLAEKRLLVTDTTMRDAHQSLLATRMRSFDMVQVADAYARNLSDLFSHRVLGRRDLRRVDAVPARMPLDAAVGPAGAIPNVLFQMLLRGANGVGYTVYPDNVVRVSCARRRRAVSMSSASSTA